MDEKRQLLETRDIPLAKSDRKSGKYQDGYHKGNFLYSDWRKLSNKIRELTYKQYPLMDEETFLNMAKVEFRNRDHAYNSYSRI